MSSEAPTTTQQNTPASTETFGQKAARWIDDPIGSVVAGMVFPTAAVSVVLGGIFGLGLIH